jgi:hypothetical protein
MRTKYAILGVGAGMVLGVALTTWYFKAWLPIRNFGRQEMLLANVYQPLDYVLRDISHDYDRGDAMLAERKMHLLQQRWSEFLHGGRDPQSFVNEIVEMQATTRPAH